VPEDVRSRFAPVAANYATAKFHSSSERLQEVLELARPKPSDLALDVATGTGNTAFALAPYVRRVVGLDLTTEMLDQARRLTAERDIKNVDWVLGDAARLPFQDERIGFVHPRRKQAEVPERHQGLNRQKSREKRPPHGSTSTNRSMSSGVM